MTMLTMVVTLSGEDMLLPTTRAMDHVRTHAHHQVLLFMSNPDTPLDPYQKITWECRTCNLRESWFTGTDEIPYGDWRREDTTQATYPFPNAVNLLKDGGA